MAQQSARRGRKNQVYSSCPEHAFMIWFRSANSHTGPQLYRCIRGRTDGSIRLRADLQKPLASRGASTDEYTSLVSNFGIAALGIPFVDDIIDLLDVALAVELQLADYGVPRSGLDRIHDRLRVSALGFRRGL